MQTALTSVKTRVSKLRVFFAFETFFQSNNKAHMADFYNEMKIKAITNQPLRSHLLIRCKSLENRELKQGRRERSDDARKQSSDCLNEEK